MAIYYSRSLNDNKGGFLDTAIHGNALPQGAVSISTALHEELIADQSQGAKIVADSETGSPRVKWPDPLSLSESRTLMTRRTKEEAERRINTISPIYRQMNDIREAQSADTMSAEATARFSKIDAIRAASDAIEAEIAAMADAAAILAIDLSNHPSWPEVN
ncbi:hypothetical protein AB1K62_00540 [Parasphingorhabdus sp. JC815]|uniref:hypothetical protein n=1 Tax=Parasphingorhabdus sp. JC815 TaxID=3232140 RepID=UPI0034595546